MRPAAEHQAAEGERACRRRARRTVGPALADGELPDPLRRPLLLPADAAQRVPGWPVQPDPQGPGRRRGAESRRPPRSSPRSIARSRRCPARSRRCATRGAQEIAAEETRIASDAAAERERLLTQTRREIEVRLRAAQRELSEHAATLALDLARQRLATEMTPADQARLVDRYLHAGQGPVGPCRRAPPPPVTPRPCSTSRRPMPRRPRSTATSPTWSRPCTSTASCSRR